MNAIIEPQTDYDLATIRRDFPILSRQVHGKPLVYLDNAATTQRPNQVIEAEAAYYREWNANIHRGVHLLSQKSTEQFEAVRVEAAKFLNAFSENEIIFTRGTTDGINLVASSWGRANVKAGDEILVSALEHHSNIVPWQMLCEEKGAKLVVLPMNDAGELLMEELPKLLNSKTRLVAVNQVSNALGTINPVTEIARQAHAVGAKVLVDGAQSVSHMPVDVRTLGADFFVLSAHKLYGPTGVGVLWGREDLLNAMPPYQGGGDMILNVTFVKTDYKKAPGRFEAGTPNVAGVVAFGAALDYVHSIGLPDEGPVVDSRRTADRDREKQGGGPVLRHRGGPSPRHRHHPGQAGGGHPGGAPLRPTHHGPPRHPRHGPRVPGHVQHP
jgi:cysteine desulfurase/selenocysteine lyase